MPIFTSGLGTIGGLGARREKKGRGGFTNGVHKGKQGFAAKRKFSSSFSLQSKSALKKEKRVTALRFGSEGKERGGGGNFLINRHQKEERKEGS